MSSKPRSIRSAGRGPGRREILFGIPATGLGVALTSACRGGEPTQDIKSRHPDPGTLQRLSAAVDARTFGVTMSGATDDSAALQAAIDAAHRDKKILLIPGGVALLSKPLSLRGRELTILGVGMGRTILRASAPMDVLIDAREDQDKILSPFELEGLSIDGAGLAQDVLALRFRHHTVLRNVHCTGGKRGIREADCWLSRRYNCRLDHHDVGCVIERNGHSSLWEGCSFVGCNEVHLLLESGEQSGDASSAVLFRSCDIEFGHGVGVRVGAGVVVSFEDCYIGENIDDVVFDNAGLSIVRGGVAFFGNTARSALIRASGGLLRFQDMKVSGQSQGTLATLVAPASGDGRFTMSSVAPGFQLAGNPILPGTPIGSGGEQNSVVAQGRRWEGFGRNCSIRQSDTAVLGRMVRCLATIGPNSQFGVRAKLSAPQELIGQPIYVVLIYTSSVPLTLQAVGGLSASGNPSFSQVLGVLPPSAGKQTYLKIDEKLMDRPFVAIELVADGSVNATMMIEAATVVPRRDRNNTTINLFTVN